MNPNSNLAVKNCLLIQMIIFHGSTSAASLTLDFRKVAEAAESPQGNVSPGPWSSVKLANPPVVSPAPGPIDGVVVDDKCSKSPFMCHDRRNLSACLIFSPTAPKEAFVLTKNNGTSPLKVNVTILNSNTTFPEMQLSGQATAKMNVSESFAQGMPLVLNAGDGECLILFRPIVSHDNIFKQFPFYSPSRTHIYGVYLVLFTALITVVTWVFCKWRKNVWQGDGVAYQELEMGKQESNSAASEKTVDAWNQDWD